MKLTRRHGARGRLYRCRQVRLQLGVDSNKFLLQNINILNLRTYEFIQSQSCSTEIIRLWFSLIEIAAISALREVQSHTSNLFMVLTAGRHRVAMPITEVQVDRVNVWQSTIFLKNESTIRHRFIEVTFAIVLFVIA